MLRQKPGGRERTRTRRSAYWDGGGGFPLTRSSHGQRVPEDVFITLAGVYFNLLPGGAHRGQGELIWSQSGYRRVCPALGANGRRRSDGRGKNFNAPYLTRLDGAGHEMWSRNFTSWTYGREADVYI